VCATALLHNGCTEDACLIPWALVVQGAPTTNAPLFVCLATFTLHRNIISSTAINQRTAHSLPLHPSSPPPQARFVTHTFQQLDQWAALFSSSAWQPALTLARAHSADIAAAFALVGKLVPGGSSSSSGSSSSTSSMLEAVLGVDAEAVGSLLRTAGHREGTWQLLRGLPDACRHDDRLLASALFISSITLNHKDAYAAEALALRQRVLGEEHPLSLGCMLRMALRLFGQSKYAEAEALLRTVVGLRQKVCERSSGLSASGGMGIVGAHGGGAEAGAGVGGTFWWGRQEEA